MPEQVCPEDGAILEPAAHLHSTGRCPTCGRYWHFDSQWPQGLDLGQRHYAIDKIEP